VYLNIAVFLAQIFTTREARPIDLEAFGGSDVEELLVNEFGREGQQREPLITDTISDSVPASSQNAETEDSADSENTIEISSPEGAESTSQSNDLLAQQAHDIYRIQLQERFTHGWPRVSVVQEWLELDTNKVCKGQIWRLITSAFCHNRLDLLHILFNMLGLIWFGIALEQMYGSREFLLFYLASALISSLSYVALDLYTGRSVPAIGASGAVMGVLMLFACHFPLHTIRIWYVFPIEMRWLVLLYVAYDLHPILLELSGDRVVTGIAHAAHLGGLAFGYVYWKQRIRLSPWLDRFENFRWRRIFKRNPGLKIHQPSSQETSQSVRRSPTANSHRLTVAATDDPLDSILRKISREGRDSLTPDELLTLESESRRLRESKGS
jgi:membrane associated rhomboid family serine protease